MLGFRTMRDQSSPDLKGTTKPASAIRTWLDRHLFAEKLENQELQRQIAEQEDRIRLLDASVKADQVRSDHLNLLNEITRDLNNLFDPPVSAQLVVTAIQKTFANELVAVYSYDDDKEEFAILATAGDSRNFPSPGFHPRADQGLMGRAAQTRKTATSNDLHFESGDPRKEDQVFHSEVAVPLIQNGLLKGLLVMDSIERGKFEPIDIATIEIAAEQLAGAWERAAYHQRLTELIQSGVSLSGSFETEIVLKQIAETTRRALDARFVFAAVIDLSGALTHFTHVGNAPLLLRSLKRDPEKDPLIRASLKSDRVIRVRDIRNFDATAHLKVTHAEYTNLLAFPLRLHQLTIGTVLVFGKVQETSFSDNDESLANLIAAQATGAIENSRLYEELDSSLQTVTLLYQLSIRILQANDLIQAAEAIAESTFDLGRAAATGIVLFTPDNEVLTQVKVDSKGKHPGSSYPTHLVNETLRNTQPIVLSEEHGACKICVPLQTNHQVYGALWLDLPDGHAYTSRYADSLQTLANQAAIALERLILLVQTNTQTHELKDTYEELETTYDQTLLALTSALDARDHETEGHSKRVGELARRMGAELNLTAKQLKALERGGFLHDIGKIGINDKILLKTGPLNRDEWSTMRQHAEIGAKIIEKVPFLSDTIAIVRYHHERWDGSGYPIGLAAAEIPLLARIFAVADTFDALISDRPYRKKVGVSQAVEILVESSGSLYDPEIVAVFTKMLEDGRFNDVLLKK
jgi:putative nucleotidyltransferase with HDIG domain